MEHVSDLDLVIVGAGAAGIGAGRAAQAAGLRFVIVEAMSRVGGRAFTDTHSIGLPWDQGCHWLHSASRNPMRRIADELGLHYASSDDIAIHHDGRWANADEVQAMLARYHEVLHQLAAHGDADVAASEVWKRDSVWDGAVSNWLAQGYAQASEAISTYDLARYEAASTNEDWPLHDGYGTLFARLASDLPIVLNAPVSAISWGRPELELRTAQGTLRARAAILSASTTVMAEERICFDPPLPEWKRAAFAAAPLGFNNKIAIRFDRDVLDGVEDSSFVLSTTSDGSAFWLRPQGQPVAITLLGEPNCARLGKLGPQASFEYALAQLTAMFGSQIERHVAQVGYALWSEEPFIGGSYSASKPGKGHLRADLARPLENRLFFAGEATSPNDFTTAHGAYQSGQDAVALLQRGQESGVGGQGLQ